jgi:integrase
MPERRFTVIKGGLGTGEPEGPGERYIDHEALLDEFGNMHDDQEHTLEVKKYERNALANMFALMSVADQEAPGGVRPATIFDLMSPEHGRELIDQLKCSPRWKNYRKRTKRKNIGILRRFIRFVLEDPFLPGFANRQSIHRKYGELIQPIRRTDYPSSTQEEPQEGAVLTRRQLWALYDYLYRLVRENPKDLNLATAAAMIFVDAESGLRISELVALDVLGEIDLSFDEHVIRTRHGKGFRGSGKRRRHTILTPLAEAVLRNYLRKVRSRIPGHDKCEALFLMQDGRRMSIQMARYWLKRVLERAERDGVVLPKGVTFHSFRRTFATLFIEDGHERLVELMALLGHRNLSTFPSYVIHSHDWLRGKIKEAYLERCA